MNFMAAALLVLMLLPGPESVFILLCKFTAFLGSLHWPVDAVDMGHFGVSFLEVLILLMGWSS